MWQGMTLMNGWTLSALPISAIGDTQGNAIQK